MASGLSKTEYEAAVRRGKENSRQPRARRAHYDHRSGHVVVELRSGAKFSFPANIAQKLAGAAEADLAQIEVSPSGQGLHWPTLDADFSVSNLMNGEFGNEAWMRRLEKRRRKPKTLYSPKRTIKSIRQTS
jgi:hypothetical protein